VTLRTTAPAIIVPLSDNHAQLTPTLPLVVSCRIVFALQRQRLQGWRVMGFIEAAHDLFIEGEAYAMGWRITV